MSACVCYCTQSAVFIYRTKVKFNNTSSTMGNWSLEIFKMAMYMTFPVAMFHIFNQPAYFEEWVTKKKRELYPPENLGHREAIQQAIRDHREKQDVQIMKALEDIEKKQKM